MPRRLREGRIPRPWKRPDESHHQDLRVPPRFLRKYALSPPPWRLAFRCPFRGLWGKFSGPNEVAKVGRRHIHDPGERPLVDLFLQELPDLPFLAVELGRAQRALGAAE